eukprot:scaffold5237_cov179-Amphora_coffeaeformis.AAC.17
MGIFQKKSGDFGSMFGRHKKEKMTSMENEDEKTLVSPDKSANRTHRKGNRKNKNNAKFRRLREEWEEPNTPKYEPPRGIDIPEVSKAENAAGNDGVDPSVPDAIEVSGSGCDTVSTLEGSLVDIVRKEHAKKKDRVSRFQIGKKQQPTNGANESNGWILDFADHSFTGDVETPKEQQKKVPKKEKKVVEPKFYPLHDNPSSEGSSKFEVPTFDHPFAPNAANIHFTCSDDYDDDFENDENVEKVSSVGSDDFHQFVVGKLPPRPAKEQKPQSKHEKSIKKAAESIAMTLSSSTPNKSRSRMVAMDSNFKRSRKVLGETKTHRNTTPSKNNRTGRRSVLSEPRRLRPIYSQKSNATTGMASSDSINRPISFAMASSSSVANSSDHSVLMGKNSSDDSLLKDLSKFDEVPTENEFDDGNSFHIGTFSQPSDSIWFSNSGAVDQKTKKKKTGQSFDSGDDLISLIQRSSRRSEDDDSKKPDPSPKSSRDNGFISGKMDPVDADTPTNNKQKEGNDVNIDVESNLEVKNDFDISQELCPEQEIQNSHSPENAKKPTKHRNPHGKTFSRPKQQFLTMDEYDGANTKNVFQSKSYGSGPSETKSKPSGVPNNAILGSMLFRHAHSESTMALPGERGRLSDPFDTEEHCMPLQVELDLMEQETVSSVTEDAGSFYHENFEKWNNRAHRALNNLYSTYHTASATLDPYIRGARDNTVSENRKTFEA